MNRKPLWSGPVPRLVVNGLCSYEAVALNTDLVPAITSIVHWARRFEHDNPIVHYGVRWGIPAVAGGLLLWAGHHLLVEQEETVLFAEKGALELSPLIVHQTYHYTQPDVPTR